MSGLKPGDRLAAVRSALVARDLHGILVLRPENRRYLSGFTGSAGGLFIDSRRALLLTDFRYIEQAGSESPHFEVVRVEKNIMESLGVVLQGLAMFRLGFEGDYLTYQQYTLMQDQLAGQNLVSSPGLVEKLRECKDSSEMNAISRAAELSDRAFQHLLRFIAPGVRERELALELEFFMRRQGADGSSFPIIAASGPRSALPHGVATDRLLASGDLLTLDFGALIDGYNSDQTRTVVLGSPTSKQLKIYKIVLEAQQAALKKIKAGVSAGEVDQAAREVIKGYGYGEYFGHGTGHGVGLAVHEAPRLSAGVTTELEPGMVVTVEPGIYLPGWGGVRTEDMVLVEDGGGKILTHSPKEELMTIK